MKLRSVIILTALACVLAVTVTAQPSTRTPKAPAFAQMKFDAVTAVIPGDGPSVLQYDGGNAVRRLDDNSGVIVGNQFNIGTFGGPLIAWTLTGMTIQNAGPAFNTTAPVVFHDGPGGGTSASILAVFAVPLTGGLQAFTFATPITGTGSFLGGILNTTTSFAGCLTSAALPTTPCDGVALDTATNAGLGFHAMQIGSTSPTGAGFATLSGENAIFRVSGTGLPVELMNFTVESGTED